MAALPDPVRIGAAPDSWGVWSAEDPRQVPRERLPDRIAEAGRAWTEPGPCGCPPADPARLGGGTARRGTRGSAGTSVTGPHRGPALRYATRPAAAATASG